MIMKKLLAILALSPALALAQTYNVSITNSLLGPVTLDFTNTTIEATGETIVTGAVFNASVTNTFSPVNNVSNQINVGDTIITNVYSEGAFQTTVTNDIDVAGVVVTNITQYLGDFTQNITTNLIDQFVGVNVFTPDLTSTNVSGTWTIALNTNAAVRRFIQTGNITSVVFSVDDTNDVAISEIILKGTTNSITWPTNNLVWAAGSAPTHTTNENVLYFRAWRDYVQGVYVDGGTP